MNDYARRRMMSRRDGHHGGYGEYRGSYEGTYDRDYRDRDYRGRDYRGYDYDMRRRDYADYDYDMRDGRRGVKGTGPYGIGGRRYYGDRAMDGSDYDMRMRDYDMRGYDDNREGGEWYVNGSLRRDYADMDEGRFTEDDMMKWKRELRNEDGTMGEHFRKEQVDQIARQIGISPDEYGMGVFCMTVNMMYSDYCAVAKKYGVDRPEFYGDMAKAFLKDKDYMGTSEDKLYTYYKCIVEK